MSDDARLTFVQESEELLEQMEDALLAMEDAPDDEEHLNSVFRAMHTIKGAAGIFGFDFIVEFTHPVETVMDQVRNQQRAIDSDLVAILLKCKDHTGVLVQAVADGAEQEIDADIAEQGQSLLERLTGQEPAEQARDMALADDGLERVGDDDRPSDNWIISLDFKADAFRNGLDPLSFIRYLGRIGEIVDIITLTHKLPEANELDAESCYLGFRIAFNSEASKDDIQGVFEFAYDDCEICILAPHSQQAHYLSLLDNLPEDKVDRLGEIMVSIGAITQRELDGALNAQETTIDEAMTNPDQSVKPLGEILVERKVAAKPVVEQALKKQEQNRDKANQESRFIRVDATRLGQLINLVGELVISNAAVKLMVEQHGLADVQEVVAEVEHLVENIRDHALELRMVPIGDTFTRFRRVVRDVSRDLGKNIELVITGGEAELDKTVVEKINDPLTHLVRNSLDHGIETPEERKAKGKPETGTLRLNALHDSGHIVIQIADDGAGLDAEKIRAKAEANGLIQPGQNLSKRELFRLIFEPGLSTKEKASNLSGRGVGMDVVKRNIEALRGNVEVDSEPDKGTLVTIQLPLTLAIIDGFMVGAGKERYVIPLGMVEECVEMESNEWSLEENRHYVNLRGDVMPYLRLTEFFATPLEKQQGKRRESLVVVRFGRNKAGFVVDELYGELQTVIKPLGKIFEHLKGISGATVLGSGEIALILDVQGLIDLAGGKTALKQAASA
jgi:two-component system chemotaxis sensor kinase CheA